MGDDLIAKRSRIDRRRAVRSAATIARQLRECHDNNGSASGKLLALAAEVAEALAEINAACGNARKIAGDSP
ncbi:MAG: hypothetical protein KGL39_25210 [Patescibacteria group bacterium]|nr:hypothetical protein [Patescibacteria group bacterium]